MKVGILTGGGDAPGLNGIIEASAKCLIQNGVDVYGIKDGFEGLIDKDIKKLSINDLEGIHAQAGTFVGTSNKFGIQGKEKELVKSYNECDFDGLIIAGGDGTFRLVEPVKDKINIIGVPKTIDNDLPGTEATFGFDTACSVVSEAVDSLRATAVAHQRVIVVEAMGRTAGWLALGSGIASYADAIFIPEIEFDGDRFKKYLIQRKKTARGLVIIAAEGCVLGDSITRKMDNSGGSVKVDDYGIGKNLVQWIEQNVDWESRAVVLGHLQRSRMPTTTDRFLTATMGVHAAKLVLSNQWRKAVVYKDGRVTDDSIEVIMGEPRLVTKNHRWLQLAKSIGIYI